MIRLNEIGRKLGFRNRTKFEKYLSIDGWLTNAEAEGLAAVASALKPGAVVVEIGSWKGKSTWCIAHGLIKGTIHCIDPFNAFGEEGSRGIYEQTKGEIDLLEQFNNNLTTVSKSVEILPHKGYSHEYVGSVENIDFLFIDGDHSIQGCRYDYENFANDIKPGGYLAFHDYDSSRKDLGPTWVIENLVLKNPAFSLYKQFDSLMVFKKVK